MLDKMAAVEARVEKIESLVARSTAELKKMIEGLERKSFSLKDSQYEVRIQCLCIISLSLNTVPIKLDLRSAMAALFCKSLTRYPENDDINVSDFKCVLPCISQHAVLFMQAAIRSTLTNDDFKKKYIVASVLKGCKDFLSNFRTDERRKVRY